MKPHPTIRLLLVVFLSLVLFAPGSVSAGLGRAAPTIPIYFLFHPQFIKNDTGASSTLFLRNSTAYFVQLSFYSEQGEWKLSQDYDVAPHSVLRVGGKEVPALPNGTYGLVVDSTARVQSVVRTLEIGAPEKLVAYAGQSTELTSRRYGPVYRKTSGLNSSIKILNTSPVPSDVTARYLSNAGLVAGTQTFALPPYGVGTFSNTLLPDGFEGWASVTSTGPMVGILLLSDSPANTVREARGPLDVETATADASVTLKRLDQVTSPLYFTACVPRALKHADQGAGPRSTTIFAGNTYAGVANAEVAFYDSGGNAVSPAVAFILPAEGAKNIQLADLAGLPNGAWAACIVSDQQLVIGELTTLDSVASASHRPPAKPAA